MWGRLKTCGRLSIGLFGHRVMSLPGEAGLHTRAHLCKAKLAKLGINGTRRPRLAAVEIKMAGRERSDFAGLDLRHHFVKLVERDRLLDAGQLEVWRKFAIHLRGQTEPFERRVNIASQLPQ